MRRSRLVVVVCVLCCGLPWVMWPALMHGSIHLGALGLMQVSEHTRIVGRWNATMHAAAEELSLLRGPKSAIPQRLIFTYKDNLLQTQEPRVLYENVMLTIAAYRAVWPR